MVEGQFRWNKFRWVTGMVLKTKVLSLFYWAFIFLKRRTHTLTRIPSCRTKKTVFRGRHMTLASGFPPRTLIVHHVTDTPSNNDFLSVCSVTTGWILVTDSSTPRAGAAPLHPGAEGLVVLLRRKRRVESTGERLERKMMDRRRGHPGVLNLKKRKISN